MLKKKSAIIFFIIKANGLGYDFVVENVDRLFRLWNHAGLKVQSLNFRTKATMNYSLCCA